MRTPWLPALIVASWLAGLVTPAASQVRPRPGGAHAGDGRSSGGSDRGLLDKGAAALAADDLPAAARLLSDAYRQFPRAAVLHALARLATAQGRTLEAYDLYRRYLADPSREADEAATRAAEALLNQPAPESGSLTVLSDPGAIVLLDGRVVATLPLLLPLLVAPGPHTVKLEFPTKSLEAPVQVELGRQTEVRMSRSSGAVLLSVLPAILWSRSGAGVPAGTGRQLADAVELFRGGVASAAYLDSRLDWDTHDDIADQGTSHEQLFAELTEIANKLAAAGLLERTTVAVLSEFSRTPKLNDQAQPGKDHWPVTSALLFGGGVRAGSYGATDEGLGALRVRMDDGTVSDSGRLLQFDNFAAGLLEFMGVSSKRWIANAEPFHGPFV